MGRDAAIETIPIVPGAPAEAVALSATGERAADLKGQISWALFEFSRSPYLGLVYIFVFAPYFTATVVGDPVRGQEIWSLANTIVGICVSIAAPVLGAISDRLGRRKPWLMAFALIMAPSCMLLWFAMPGAESGLPVFAIALLIVVLAASFEYSQVFHNAMLPSIASQARIGGLSGLGLALGNAGGFLGLTVMLFAVALPASQAVDWSFLPDAPLFGLDPTAHEHERIAGPVAGLWLLVFILPLMLWTPDRPATGVAPARAVREGLAQLWRTIRRVREVSNVGKFLLARMLYNDGKTAIIAYCGIYAAGTFGWDMAAMLIFALVLSFFSIVGGFLGGWLDDTFGSKRAIQITIGVTCLGMLGAVSMTRTTAFFLTIDPTPVWSFPYFRTLPELLYVLMFMVLAATITAAFANSRTMMARIAPASMMSQFFGLYALSGTATAFLGHALVAVFTRWTGDQRVGFASVIILLVAGFALMPLVREERAKEIA